MPDAETAQREVWTANEADCLIHAMSAATGLICIVLSALTVWWWACVIPLGCAIQAFRSWRRAIDNAEQPPS